MDSKAQRIEKVLSELTRSATELSALLEPLEKEVGEICTKPLKEMSVSEKIKLAKLVVAISKGVACG